MVMQRKYAKAKELFQKASPYWLVQHALTTHVQVPPVMSVHGEVGCRTLRRCFQYPKFSRVLWRGSWIR